MNGLKKFLNCFFSTALVVGLMPGLAYAAPISNPPASEPSGLAPMEMDGEGTEDDPYLITSAEDFAAFVENMEEMFCGEESARLEADIVLGSDWSNAAGDLEADEDDFTCVFSGTFDGNGHSITLNSTYDEKNAGLFSVLNGATVKDLTIKGTVVNASSVANASTGALAGSSQGNTTIQNVVNEATVTSNAAGTTIASVGGLIGFDTSSGGKLTITDSVNKGAVKFSAAASSARHSAGGLLGYTEGSATAISSCYNAGAVSNATYAGGIVGSGYSYGGKAFTIASCYNSATISGAATMGGILGAAAYDSASTDTSTVISNCCALEGTELTAAVSKITVKDSRVVSADALKANPSVLGSSFLKDPAGGYPVRVSELGAVNPATQLDIRYVSADEAQGTLSCGGERVAVGSTAGGSTATAAEGYQFAGWQDASGATVSTDATFKPTATATASGTVTYTATFEEGAEPTPPSQTQEVIIGEGTSSSNDIPYGNYYKNSLSEMLYTSEEIGTAGSIESIAFNVISTGTVLQRNAKVYMGHMPSSTTSLSDFTDPADMVLVYENATYSFGGEAGWETIKLDTPFEYNGTDSLAIYVLLGGGASDSRPLEYAYTDTSNNISVYKRQDGNVAYSSLAVAKAQSAQTNPTKKRPNIKLDIAVCDHENKTFKETVAPTCTEEGYDVYHCSDCDKDVKLNKTEALGHDPLVQVTLKETCETDGTKTTTCKRAGCDYRVEETIPATGHNRDWEHATVLDDKGNVRANCLNGCGKTKDRNLYVSEWEGNTEAWTEGDGSETNPYVIESAANLAYLAQQVKGGEKYTGKHFRLETDVDLKNLSWTPIGVYVPASYAGIARTFEGSFDGDGHTIANLRISSNEGNSYSHTISLGLFGMVKNAAIKNVSVTSGIVEYAGTTSVSAAAGGIVGYVDGTTTIERCFNAAALQDATYIGGIVGRMSTGAALTMNECGNSGTITTKLSQASLGGLVGYTEYSFSGATSLMVQNSRNTGNVTASFGGSSAYAGGLFGNINSTDISCKASYSNAKIVCPTAGGLVGQIAYASGKTYNFSSCVSSGDFSGGTNVGGILGYGNGLPDSAAFKNCVYVSTANGAGKAIKESMLTNCLGTDAAHCNSGDAIAILNTELDPVDVGGVATPVFSAGVTAPVLYWELDTLPAPAVSRAATFTVVPAGAALALTDATTQQVAAIAKDAAASTADADVYKATLDPTHDYSLNITKQYYGEQTVSIPASPYQDSFAGVYQLVSEFDGEAIVGNVASMTSGSAYYAPFRMTSNSAVVEMLYTANEINASASEGAIKSLGFYVDSSSEVDSDLKIYLGHTASASISSDYVAPTDLTLVYDGHLALGSAQGWEMIDFDRPFAYDHTSNLVVITVHSAQATDSRLTYKIEQKTTPRSVWGRYTNDAAYGDLETAVSADTAGTAMTSTHTGYRPIVRFGINKCTHSEMTDANIRTVAPTCTERGYIAKVCPMCNATVEKTYNAEPLGHDTIETVTLAPTCESEGVKTTTCKRCDYSLTEDVAALGHNWDWEHATVLDDKGNVEANCLNGCGKTKTKNLFVDEWDGTVASWTEGDGSETSPYLIESCANLAYLAEQVNGGENYAGMHFELTMNLDLNDLPWTPIGISSGKVAAFSGSFDGHGHKISNLSISFDSSKKYGIGLFGEVEGATIANLHIVSGNVSGQGDPTYVGGLIGRVASGAKTTVTCCSNGADVSGYMAGGIIGYNAAAVEVSSCKNTGAITGLTVSTYSPGFAGGIIGQAYQAISIMTCYSAGNVTAEYAGGIAGRIGYSTSYLHDVRNCFATQMPTGANAGGLFGRIQSNNGLTVQNCYWAGSENAGYAYTTVPTLTDCEGLDDFTSLESIAKLNAGLDKVTVGETEMDVFSLYEEGDLDHPLLFWEPRVPVQVIPESDALLFVLGAEDDELASAQTISLDYNGSKELTAEVADEQVATAELGTDEDGATTLTVTPAGVGSTTITVSDGKRSCEIDVTVTKLSSKGGSLRMDKAVTAADTATSLRMGFDIEVPEGMSASDFTWRWIYGLDGEVDPNLVRTGENYVMDGSTLVTNIVFTGVEAPFYKTSFVAQLEVTMTVTDADGTSHDVTVTHPVQKRSVLDVANAIKADPGSSQAEKDYANAILTQASK